MTYVIKLSKEPVTFNPFIYLKIVFCILYLLFGQRMNEHIKYIYIYFVILDSVSSKENISLVLHLRMGRE